MRTAWAQPQELENCIQAHLTQRELGVKSPCLEVMRHLRNDQWIVHHKAVRHRQYQMIAHPVHTRALDRNFPIIRPVNEFGLQRVETDRAGNDAQ